jgi:2-C-methyl-D-erythritol 4-phosphate cytidylyltransferase
MLEWSLDAFRAAGVGRIVVALPAEVLGSPGHPSNPEQVGPPGDRATDSEAAGPVVYVAGGATRAQSVSNALEEIEEELVAIHDAARPLVTPELIAGVTATLEADPGASAAVAAAPITDTVKRAADSSSPALTGPCAGNVGLVVEETLDRVELWAAQTPQVFRVAALRDALAAHSDPASATDEATLIEAAGGRVLIHPSSSENLKVTTPFDLRVVERQLAST